MKRFVRKQLYWLADLLHAAAESVYTFTSWPMEELRGNAWEYESKAFIACALSGIDDERSLVRLHGYSDRCLKEKRESVERAWDATFGCAGASSRAIHKKQQESKTA